MFDIGASELLLIVVVAIVVIGPKDLPRALRLAGQWIAKVRRVSGHFRSGIESMIREAELAEMEKKWREQNEAIMKANPTGSATDSDAWPEASAEAALPPPDPTPPTADASPAEKSEKQGEPEPQLPLPPP
jgi:sec-independent protein translocase protein TatB